MSALIAALALMALEPAAQPSADPAEADLLAARATYAEAQKVFRDSCETRAYAAYDDLCEQLGKQVRAYAVEVDRLTLKAEAEAARKSRRP